MKDDRKQRVPASARPALSWHLRPETWKRFMSGSGEGVLFIVIAPLAGGFFLSWWLFSGSAPWLQWASAVIFPAVLLAGALVGFAYLDSIMRTRDETRRDLLPRGQCAACTFSLRGIPPEEDGCTVCPECGSAWNVQRPEITDGKDRYVVDATGSKRRQCPEFASLRKRHREPRRPHQYALIGVQVLGGGVMIAGAALMGIGILVIPGLITLIIGGVMVLLSMPLIGRKQIVENAVAAALGDGRCPACWAEFGPEATTCDACFATWRVQSADD